MNRLERAKRRPYLRRIAFVLAQNQLPRDGMSAAPLGLEIIQLLPTLPASRLLALRLQGGLTSGRA